MGKGRKYADGQGFYKFRDDGTVSLICPVSKRLRW
jgi:hypothetical protein